MWRYELAIEFHKGTHFAEACDRVAVPVDALDEAKDLWGNWIAQEQFEAA